jgi:hypothetical protein
MVEFLIFKVKKVLWSIQREFNSNVDIYGKLFEQTFG